MKRSLASASKLYVEQLNSGTDLSKVAVTYLQNRGITKPIADYFQLGLVENPDPESGHDFMIGRLAIPYITPTGIMQIRFRAIPEGGLPGGPEASPKIKSEAGASNTLYNVSVLTGTATEVAICEGEFDTMTVQQAGIPAVGVAGAQAWQDLYYRAFLYRRVIIVADNDDHGEGLKFAEKVQASVRGSRIVLMPSGYDANSCFVNIGRDEFRKVILGHE